MQRRDLILSSPLRSLHTRVSTHATPSHLHTPTSIVVVIDTHTPSSLSNPHSVDDLSSHDAVAEQIDLLSSQWDELHTLHHSTAVAQPLSTLSPRRLSRGVIGAATTITSSTPPRTTADLLAMSVFENLLKTSPMPKVVTELRLEAQQRSIIQPRLHATPKEPQSPILLLDESDDDCVVLIESSSCEENSKEKPKIQGKPIAIPSNMQNTSSFVDTSSSDSEDPFGDIPTVKTARSVPKSNRKGSSRRNLTETAFLDLSMDMHKPQKVVKNTRDKHASQSKAIKANPSKTVQLGFEMKNLGHIKADNQSEKTESNTQESHMPPPRTNGRKPKVRVMKGEDNQKHHRVVKEKQEAKSTAADAILPIETAQRSSRGRIIVKPLDYWRNEKLETQKDGTVVGIVKGSADELHSPDKPQRQKPAKKPSSKPKSKIQAQKVSKATSSRQTSSAAPTESDASDSSDVWSESEGDSETLNSKSTNTKHQDDSSAPQSISNWSELSVDSWTHQDVLQLKASVSATDPLSKRFWEDVALKLPNKTADECYKKYQEFYRGSEKSTSTKGKAEQNTATILPVQGFQIEGGAGTLKRKRAFRQALQLVNGNHTDDIFESTPIKQRPQNDEHLMNFCQDFDDYILPVTGKDPEEMTPAKKHESSFDADSPFRMGILKPYEQGAMDGYIVKMQQRRKVNLGKVHGFQTKQKLDESAPSHGSRQKATNAKHVASKRMLQETRKSGQLRGALSFPQQPTAHEDDDDETHDYFWSDAEEDAEV